MHKDYSPVLLNENKTRKRKPIDDSEKVVIKASHVCLDFDRQINEYSSVKELVIDSLKGKRRKEKFRALDDISFRIKKGEVVGIIGTNGAGKSTLLKVVSGALKPTSGKMRVDKRKVQILTLGTGFDMELTGKENVYLNGSIIGYTKEFIDEHYDEIVDFAELGDFMNEKVKNYSSGMVSRLGFAIATVGNAAEILILDEVLSVGDKLFREKSLARVKEMIHGGSTVLMVSHSTATIRDNCTKAIWIEKGHLVEVGDAKEVCTRYDKYDGNIDELLPEISNNRVRVESIHISRKRRLKQIAIIIAVIVLAVGIFFLTRIKNNHTGVSSGEQVQSVTVSRQEAKNLLEASDIEKLDYVEYVTLGDDIGLVQITEDDVSESGLNTKEIYENRKRIVDALIGELVKKSTFTGKADELVEQRYREELKKQEGAADKKNISIEEYVKNAGFESYGEFVSKLKLQCENDIKRELVIYALSYTYELELSSKQYEAAAAQMASVYGYKSVTTLLDEKGVATVRLYAMAYSNYGIARTLIDSNIVAEIRDGIQEINDVIKQDEAESKDERLDNISASQEQYETSQIQENQNAPTSSLDNKTNVSETSPAVTKSETKPPETSSTQQPETTIAVTEPETRPSETSSTQQPETTTATESTGLETSSENVTETRDEKYSDSSMENYKAD